MSCGSKNASGTLQLQVEDFHVRKPFPKTVPTGASIRRRVNTVIRSREKMTGVRRINYEPVNRDRKSTRLNSSHQIISYAVFCLKKKKKTPLQASPTPLI